MRPSSKHFTTTSTGTLLTGTHYVTGIALHCSATGGTVSIYDNTSATGTPVIQVHLAANDEVIQELPNIRFNTGVHVVISAGTMNIAVFVA